MPFPKALFKLGLGPSLCGHLGRRRSVMGLSELDPAACARVSWNRRCKVGEKRALKPRQIWTVRLFLDQNRHLRHRALFDLATDSKLRGCDLVKIRLRDIVCDRKIRTRATVVQQKSRMPVQFELIDDAQASLLKWLELRGGALEEKAQIQLPGNARTLDVSRSGVMIFAARE